MNSLNFTKNLLSLRQERGITQETLASFMGVTKASVSKWETGQSLPDILLLPQLAGFFGVTVDELLGYEPQLGKEQIRKLYASFASDFASKPFQEVMDATKKLVKKYYSCYPFLFQICVLWLNHYALAPSREEQTQLLEEIGSLCEHVIQNSQSVSLQNDAVFLKAAANLAEQKPLEVISALEDLMSPYRFSVQNSSSLLIQAYQQAGMLSEAERFCQFAIFQDLQNLLSSTALYLTLKPRDPEFCRDFLASSDALIAAYQMDRLDPNVTAQYQFTAAILLCSQGKPEEALKRLRLFLQLSFFLLDHIEEGYWGKAKYFERLADISETSDLGNTMVRDKKTILQGMEQALDSPAFLSLKEDPEFLFLKKELKKKGEFL